MSDQPNANFPSSLEPEKKGMGTGAKVGIGCGIGCLGLIVVAVIGGFLAVQWVQGKITEFEEEFAAKGFTEGQSGQIIELTEPPTEPSFYKAQLVTIDLSAPVTVEFGVLAQQIEILNGTFQENVYCRGQVVILGSGAIFEKDIDVTCQLVQDQGAEIRGELTGSYSAKQ